MDDFVVSEGFLLGFSGESNASESDAALGWLLRGELMS